MNCSNPFARTVLGLLAGLFVLVWAGSALSAPNTQSLVREAAGWYAVHCDDPKVDLYPSDESKRLMAKLKSANERTGEPSALAWRGVIALCVGQEKVGMDDLKMFWTIAGDIEVALATRVRIEVALRQGDCGQARRRAMLLAAQAQTVDEVRAILRARTRCKAKCEDVLSTAEQLEGLKGDLTPFEPAVDSCRASLAVRAEQAEKERLEVEARAKHRAELEPKFASVSEEYARARKKARPSKLMGIIGLAGGGTLAVLSVIPKAQGEGYARAAAEAYTGEEYQEQADQISSANASIGILLGSGAALLVSGAVGTVISVLHAKKSKAVRERHDALRRELDELDAQEGN